jgi:hypothetical protein
MLKVWTKRSFTLRLGIFVLALLGITSVAIVFHLDVRGQQAPPLPHAIEGRADCLSCHGPTGPVPVASDHSGRTNDQCVLCHTAPAKTSTSAAPGKSTVPPVTAAPAPGPAVAISYLDQNNCLACHGNPSLTKKLADGTSISLYVNATELSQTVHRWEDCTTCHTIKPHDVPTPLTKLSLAQKCGTCHQYEYSQYLASIHGRQETAGNTDAATCTDCHSADSNPHNIIRVLDPSASTYPKNIAQTCAKCHNDPKLMGKYGIVEKVYDSYIQSFHGKAMQLASDKLAIQELNTATCVNCHGAHDVKAVNDPSSPVAGMDNLVKTCEQCHPGAGVKFASGFLGHKAADPTFLPQVYWGEKFFSILIRVVLAGGVLLVALTIGRWGVGRIVGEGKPSKKKEE